MTKPIPLPYILKRKRVPCQDEERYEPTSIQLGLSSDPRDVKTDRPKRKTVRLRNKNQGYGSDSTLHDHIYQ